MISCPACGKEIESGLVECPHCQAKLEGTEPVGGGDAAAQGAAVPPPTAPVPPATGDGQGGGQERKKIPFEDPAYGFFSGLVETVKLSLFQPTRFFGEYRMDGSIGRPMVFAIVVGWFATVIALIWGMLFNASIMTMISQYVPANELPRQDLLPQFLFSTAASVASLILAPIIIVIGLFIMAGLYHLFLLMVNGANRGFESTFNVAAYSMSAKLFLIIPFCGGTIAWIYKLVISIIGLSEAHQTDGWKGAFAVLMPFVLCCCCVLIFVLMSVMIPALASR